MASETPAVLPEAAPEDLEALARADLETVARDLEAAVARLQALHASLPVSPRADLMLVHEEDLDFPTAARSSIECILDDHLRPAIRDARAIAAFQGKRPESEE